MQLVCQSMSYLLQSQIDIVERDAKFESLTEKVTTLLSISFSILPSLKVNLLTRIVLPSDDNKPLKVQRAPAIASNNDYDVNTPLKTASANGSYISPVTSSSTTAITSPEIAFNLSIAATPLTSKVKLKVLSRN